MDKAAKPVDVSLIIEALDRICAMNENLDCINNVYNPVSESDLWIAEWKRCIEHITSENHFLVGLLIRYLAQTGQITWAEAAARLKECRY